MLASRRKQNARTSMRDEVRGSLLEPPSAGCGKPDRRKIEGYRVKHMAVSCKKLTKVLAKVYRSRH